MEEIEPEDYKEGRLNSIRKLLIYIGVAGLIMMIFAIMLCLSLFAIEYIYLYSYQRMIVPALILGFSAGYTITKLVTGETPMKKSRIPLVYRCYIIMFLGIIITFIWLLIFEFLLRQCGKLL